MTNQKTLAFILAAIAMLAAGPTKASAQEWTGNGTSLNWSDTGNWSSGTTPNSSSYLYFSDATHPNAYTNVAGAINTVLDGNYAAGTAIFNALAGAPGNHFYSTLIPSGNTLTLGGLSGTALAVGDEPGLSYFNTAGLTNYSTFTGAGTLLVNDPFSIVSVGTRNRATLDLAGLDNFTASLISLHIGSSYANPNNSGITGWLLLAKTNSITTTTGLGAPGILMGHLTNATGTAVARLGQVNNFNTDGLVVGGRRSTANIFVSPAYSNTPAPGNFKLRGSAGGSTPIPVLAIGDASANADGYSTPFVGTAASATGTADFSGATVDILADSMFVGRASSVMQVASGTGNGTLIVEQGTVTTTNLYVAYKPPGATNATVGQGLVTLRSNAVMNVVKDVALVYRTNGTAFINDSRITVNGNAILNIGGNLTTTHTVGSWTPASLNLGGGTINLTGDGTVTVPTLNGFGTVNGASSITVTNALAINTDVLPGTLNLGNNLTLANPFGLTFNLGANTTIGGGVNDYMSVPNNVTFNNNPINLTYYGGPLVTGTYTLIAYGGSQAGSVTWANPTRSAISLSQGSGQVALVVSSLSPATLTWRSSGASGNWGSPVNNTTVSATNWNGNTERFLTFDHVVFDDTGVAPAVAITNVVIPGSITFNNSSVTYTISQTGPGRISGYTGITKNGTGTVNFGGSTVNDFTGPININAGTIKVSSFNTSIFGTNSNSSINITSGGTLDMNGNNAVGSAGTHGHLLNLAGSGAGGVGAITKSAGTGQATLTTSGVTLTADTTLSCTSGSRLVIGGTFPPYNSVLNLGGNNLTTSGIEVRLNQLVITNNGIITVNSTSLSLQNCIVNGTGNIDLGNKGLYFNSWTTGYLAKPITVNGGFFSTVSATATPLLIGSAITLNGNLNYTNLQPTRLTNVISGVGSLTKYGATNLTLEAANTYSGATTIAGGRLTLGNPGSLASTLIQVDAELDVTAHGAGYNVNNSQTLALGVAGTVLGNISANNGSTLTGSGIGAGSVTVAPGGTIAPGGALAAGTLIVTNNLTFNGGTNSFKLGSDTTPGAGLNDLVVVGGNLTFNAPTTIRILPVGSVSASPYTLFQYAGTLTGAENLTVTSSLRPGTIYTLDTNTPGVVLVTVASASANLVWGGGAPGNPTAWNVGTTTNWNNLGLPDYFYQGDRVTFDDTAITSLATISAQTQPAAMTNNVTGTMVLNGPGNLLAGNLVANSGNLVIANTNNNLFNGEGIFFNGGNVSFSQPAAAAISTKLSGGSGALNKNGANTLSITSSDSTNLTAAVNINGGTLRPTTYNALGSGTITIASGATLDVNGQNVNAGTVRALGAGADGQGAINNRGFTQTNAIGNLILDGDVTIGAASNRWDVFGGSVQGNNYALTKVGGSDVVLMAGSDTGLGDVNVNVGRLIFGGVGNDLGNTVNTITIAAGATNGFTANITAGAKPMNILSNGVLASLRLGTATESNSFAGPITLNTNAGPVVVDVLSDLNLAGSITGTGTLIAGGRGTVTLSGTNNYRGSTLLRLGSLSIADNRAIPTNSPVVVTNIGTPSSDTTFLNLLGGITTPTNAPLTMYSSRSGSGTLSCSLGGDGTWGGPLAIRTSQIGTTGDPQVGFVGGSAEGLTVVGNVDGTNQIGSLNITGQKQSFEGAVVFGATVSIGNNGLGDATGVTMTRVSFNATNSWTNTFIPRALVTIGANNAIPPNAPIQVGTLTAGTIIHLIGFDLNGFNQTLSSLTERAVTTAFHNDTVWFYNNSTNADSTLTYAGTGTNTWSAAIVDNLDPANPLARKLGLSVTSGRLVLEYVADRAGVFNYDPSFVQGSISNGYTGPTLVSGGALIVNSELGLTPITVSGTGLFGGTGVISGPITIASGGTLAPGRSIGTLTANSSLLLQAGSKCLFEVNLGTGLNDQIVGLDNVTYGGTLVITNVGAQPFTNGTVLQLFSAGSYNPGPVAVQPASPGAGLAWDSSYLTVDGTLRVKPGAPIISGLTVLPTGNFSFTLTGTAGQPYSVLASTNVALPLPSWSVLASGNMSGSVLNFTDLNATNHPVRFYTTSSP